ncbi:MAG: hypothetical protein GKS06_13605 [Acidobacteria bacterium]|nr:hypothetical protein [Acidobacteriota bacterium]
MERRSQGRNAARAVVLLGSLASLAGCEAVSPTVQQAGLAAAERAYARFEVEAATEGFREVYEESGATAPDRAEAARRLAAIRRLFHEDLAGARDWTDRAEVIGDRPFETTAERVRQHLSGADWAAAATSARVLLQQAETSLEAGRAAGMLVRAVWRHLYSAAESGEPPADDLIDAGRDAMRRFLRMEWGRLDLARAGVGLALAADDGTTAFVAWTSYFHWDGPDDRRHITNTGQRIEALLAEWKGPAAAAQERRALVRALVDSRMFRAAAWLALDPRVPPERRIDTDPVVLALIGYARFQDQVEASAARHYRLRAFGEPFSSELNRGFDAAATDLWPLLRTDGATYRRSEFVDELARRYGAQVHFRGPGGRNLNYGHWVVDRTLDVEQYGRSASFRFVRLDFMVSNGFNTWFWDGGSSTGGWAQDGTIVQIRPVYARGPIDAWRAVTDEVERRRTDDRIDRLAPMDRQAAAAQPAGYFEGLWLRLRRQGREQVLQDLASRGLESSDLRRAFIRELSERTFASSIVAHEGRHAIDRLTQPIVTMMRPAANKEYRAKLSEVAFAPSPRIALVGGIVSENIGADTAHGQANARIMRHIIEWMGEHADAIPGLDRSSPLLLQLDLLSDDQLRAAFRAMDPWG